MAGLTSGHTGDLAITSEALTRTNTGSSGNPSDEGSDRGAFQNPERGRRRCGRPRKSTSRVDESKREERQESRFAFVSQDQRGLDDEATKTIRSHAMLAVRRDQREQRRALNQASKSVEQAASNATIPQNLSEFSSLNSGVNDPFDSLPITTDNATFELLQRYFEVGRPNSLPESLGSQLEYFRKIDWPPMPESKAAYSARLAWIELQREGFSFAEGQVSYNDHLSQAFAEINEAIQNIDQTPIDSVCYAVALCMSAACVAGDFHVLEAHFYGLSALLAHRATMASENEYLITYLVRFGLVHFYPGILTANKFMKTQLPLDHLRQRPPIFVDLPAFLLQDSGSVLNAEDLAKDQVGKHFDVLYQKGLISLPLYDFVLILRTLRILQEKSASGQLTAHVAMELIRHIWIGSCTLYNLQAQCQTPLEKACRYAMLLHFYLPFFPTPPILADRIRSVLLRQLRLIDLDQLLVECAGAAVWLVLTAGAFATGTARLQVSRLWVTVRNTLNMHDYVDTVEKCCNGFLWGRYMDESASSFWSKSTGVRRRASDIFTEDPEDAGIADLMEVCELEMTVLGLVPAGL